jgi:hypothetical protein
VQHGLIMPNYVSGRYYQGGLPGTSGTSTNTTPLVNDTLYSVLSIAAKRISISGIVVRTSSSSASVGGALKAGIYAADGANGAPGTRLGLTTAGVAVADSAVNTTVEFTLDAAVVIPPGPFWVVFLQTSSTGIRLNTINASTPHSQYMGSTSNAVLAGTAIVYGYTAAQSYASGLPAAFGKPVVNTTLGLAPVVAYKIS